MTGRTALIASVTLALVLTASAIAVATLGGSGDDHGTQGVASSRPAQERVVVVNPATGAVIGQRSIGNRRVVILDPTNGQVISSVGELAP